MKRYLAYLSDLEARDALDFGLGDWIALDNSTPRILVATHGYLRLLRNAYEIADRLDDTRWRTELTERLHAIDEWLRAWNLSRQPSQTELALLLDLADARGEQEESDELFGRLVDKISDDGDVFTVGEIAIEPLLTALHRRQHDELIYRIIKRDDVPGYGMQLAKGATALAETWSAEDGPEGEGSNNHFMLGMIDHWLHDHVAGLRQAADSIAWAEVVVEPVFLMEVESATSTHNSPAGVYSVTWQRQVDGGIKVGIQVPAGGSAHVVLPGVPPHRIGHGFHPFAVLPQHVPRSSVDFSVGNLR